MFKAFLKAVFILVLTAACACSPTSDNSKPNAGKDTPPKSDAKPLPAYVRSDWGDWADDDKDCLNTRHEILKDRSLISVEMNAKNNCLVAKGQWIDFYSGEEITSARDIDIDHVVPVKIAHELSHGQWPRERRKAFYNDYENLVVTSLKYNREKGANDITMWQPANKAGACRQMQVWMKIKKKYDLMISKEELEYERLLGDCGPYLD